MSDTKVGADARSAQGAGWLRRNTLCKLGLCGCITGGNDTHLWAECVRCGRVSSVLSRETMRAYMERTGE
jgi:hypothetical protein